MKFEPIDFNKLKTYRRLSSNQPQTPTQQLQILFSAGFANVTVAPINPEEQPPGSSSEIHAHPHIPGALLIKGPDAQNGICVLGADDHEHKTLVIRHVPSGIPWG